MKAHVHDDETEAKEHGPLGPSHRGTLTVDYEYQLEQFLIDLPKDDPKATRVVSEDGREWRKTDKGEFHQVIP